MAIYTVHIPPDAGDADRIEFIRDGFSLPAMLFGPFWLVARRLWLGLAGWLVVAGVIAALGLATGKDTAALEILFALWFGLEAIGIRRFTLERRGYTLAGVVEGVDRDAAERRFFSHWLKTTPRTDIHPPAVGRATPPGDDGVIGLFPASVVPTRPGPGGHHQPM